MFDFLKQDSGYIPLPKDFIAKIKKAPGDYVKVYLYGLYLTEEKKGEDIACALDMTENKIREALIYWQKQGLLSYNGASWSFSKSVENFVPVVTVPDEKQTKEFISSLCNILGRNLKTTEIKMFIDMCADNDIPEDMVTEITKHVSSEEVRGKKVSVNYIKGVVEHWAREGIKTKEQAQEKIHIYNAYTSGLIKTLRSLGIKGSPTPAQEELYKKWTEQMGFGQDSIVMLARETSITAQSPSMKYLDSVLTAYYKNGKISPTDIDSEKYAADKKKEQMVQVLTTLGYSRKTIRADFENCYDSWRKMGFEHCCILKACAHCASVGNRSYKKADSILKQWKQKGIVSETDIEKYLSTFNKNDAKILQMFECAGIKSEISEADRKNFQRFHDADGMSTEVLLLAAEMSSIKEQPKSFMYTMLYSWEKKGIKTVQAAQQAVYMPSSKESGEYMKHNYSDDDFNDFRKSALEEMENFDG